MKLEGISSDKEKINKLRNVININFQNTSQSGGAINLGQATELLYTLFNINNSTNDIKLYGPNVLINILVLLGFKTEIKRIYGNNVKVLISYDNWINEMSAEDKLIWKTLNDHYSDRNGIYLSLSVKKIIFFLNKNYQFLNKHYRMDSTEPDKKSGVKYNMLKENIDLEALQHEIQKNHLRFKTFIKSSPGYNLGVNVNLSGGSLFSVNKKQFKGGMLPISLTNSLTNQTPIYAKDIEYQIRKMINLLKVEGKYLTPNDETKLNTAIDKLSDEEEKLKVLSKSFENMLMDPNFNPNNSEITHDDVVKYSSKVERGQRRLIDILKSLNSYFINTTLSTR